MFSFGEQNFGADTITDFKAGGAPGAEIDRIMLVGGAADSIDDLNITDDGSNATIDFGNENVITLTGVTEAQLHAGNFIVRPDR